MVVTQKAEEPEKAAENAANAKAWKLFLYRSSNL